MAANTSSAVVLVVTGDGRRVSNVARLLRNGLEQRGVVCNTIADTVPEASQSADHVRAAIDQSDAVVILLAPRVHLSTNQREAYQYSKSRGMIPLPLVLPGAGPPKEWDRSLKFLALPGVEFEGGLLGHAFSSTFSASTWGPTIDAIAEVARREAESRKSGPLRDQLR